MRVSGLKSAGKGMGSMAVVIAKYLSILRNLFGYTILGTQRFAEERGVSQRK
jgi:hypothetical protein